LYCLCHDLNLPANFPPQVRGCVNRKIGLVIRSSDPGKASGADLQSALGLSFDPTMLALGAALYKEQVRWRGAATLRPVAESDFLEPTLLDTAATRLRRRRL